MSTSNLSGHQISLQHRQPPHSGDPVGRRPPDDAYEYQDRSIVDLLEVGRDEDDTPIFGIPQPPEPATQTSVAGKVRVGTPGIENAEVRPTASEKTLNTNLRSNLPTGFTVEGLGGADGPDVQVMDFGDAW